MKKLDFILPFAIILIFILGCGKPAPPPEPPVENDKLIVDGGKKEGALEANQKFTYSVDVKKNNRTYIFIEGQQYNLKPEFSLKDAYGNLVPFDNAAAEFGTFTNTKSWYKFASAMDTKLFIELYGTNIPIKYRVQLKGGCGAGSFDILKKLQVGGAFQEGNIEEGGYVADYIFDSQEKKITIIVDPDNTLTPYIEILDDKCNGGIWVYTGGARGKTAQAEFTPQFKGRYIIRVRMENGMGGKFRIALR